MEWSNFLVSVCAWCWIGFCNQIFEPSLHLRRNHGISFGCAFDIPRTKVSKTCIWSCTQKGVPMLYKHCQTFKVPITKQFESVCLTHDKLLNLFFSQMFRSSSLKNKHFQRWRTSYPYPQNLARNVARKGTFQIGIFFIFWLLLFFIFRCQYKLYFRHWRRYCTKSK